MCMFEGLIDRLAVSGVWLRLRGGGGGGGEGGYVTQEGGGSGDRRRHGSLESILGVIFTICYLPSHPPPPLDDIHPLRG